MRRLSLTLLLGLTLGPSLLAQSWEEVVSGADYIWGEGWGRSVEEADREALASLGTKIEVAVTSRFSRWEEQSEGTSGRRYAALTDASLSTVSATRLFDTRRVVLQGGRKAHVGRWIPRSELERQFDDRRTRILEYETLARRAEGSLLLGDALRYYWWAYVLLRSMKRPSELRDADGVLLSVSIPERLHAILDGLGVSARTLRGGALVLSFSYRGKPVRGLDFRLFTGSGWSRRTPVRDGSATLQLPAGALGEVVQIQLEYAYADMVVLDEDLSVMLKDGSVPPLKESRIIFRRQQ